MQLEFPRITLVVFLSGCNFAKTCVPYYLRSVEQDAMRTIYLGLLPVMIKLRLGMVKMKATTEEAVIRASES